MAVTVTGGTLGLLTNNPLLKMKTSNETLDCEDLGDASTTPPSSARPRRPWTPTSHPGLAVDGETGRMWIRSFATGLETTCQAWGACAKGWRRAHA